MSGKKGGVDFAAPPSFYRAGTGPPLVLLHGFTNTWRVWQTVIPELEKHHEVFAPTLPGHFGADAWEIPQPLHLDQVVDAVEQKLDDAGIKTAHIVGNSLGGWLALDLGARGRAISVVALCPGGGWVRGNHHERRILGYFKRGYRMSQYFAPRADWIAKNPWIRRYSVRDLVGHPELITAESFADSLRSAAGCDIVPHAIKLARTEGFGDLGRIDCPVRIAWGTKDRIIRWPGCYARFPTLVPGAEYVRLEGLGHIPMLEDPETVARTILEVTAHPATPGKRKGRRNHSSGLLDRN